MSTPREQNFGNHAQMVPGFHYVTGLLLFAYLVGAIWRALSLRDLESHFDLLGAFALAGTYWYCRAFPLKAQDRIIRLEEQLRLTRLLPDDLRARVTELSPRQLIALRFASDAELPSLVRWVLDERITDAKAIKQKVATWRPDHFRV